MLDLISSIPTTVHEGFNVQELPARASTLNEDSLKAVFGGACYNERHLCFQTVNCCPGLECRGLLLKRCYKS